MSALDRLAEAFARMNASRDHDDIIRARGDVFDAVAELLAAREVLAEREGYVLVPRDSLRWWRQLVDLNPQDLAPRIEAMLADAPAQEVKP